MDTMASLKKSLGEFKAQKRGAKRLRYPQEFRERVYKFKMATNMSLDEIADGLGLTRMAVQKMLERWKSKSGAGRVPTAKGASRKGGKKMTAPAAAERGIKRRANVRPGAMSLAAAAGGPSVSFSPIPGADGEIVSLSISFAEGAFVEIGLSRSGITRLVTK